MARLQSVSEQFRIAKQGTLEQTRQVVIRTAKTEHAKIMATVPVPGSFTRVVDGKQSAPEEDVKANGVILYEYRRIDVVAQFALDTLREKSPVGSVRDEHPGLYRDSHILFLNGEPVEIEALAAWKPGDDVAICNFVPYARKIEAGAMTMTVPGSDHVYEQAEQIVNGRYGNLAKATFAYRGIAGGGFVGGRPGNKSENRFPALVITPR